jgi:hypothetical protein
MMDILLNILQEKRKKERGIKFQVEEYWRIQKE